MYNKAIQPQNRRWVDWFAAICLLLLLIIAITRLSLTKWVDNLEVAGWLIILGAVSGYVLGRSRLHWMLSLLSSIIISVFVVPFTFMMILSEQHGFIARALDVWDRILSSTNELLANQPVSDSILFLVGAGVIFWLLGLSSGFSLVRSAKPWIPLILLGIAVLVIEGYQPENRRSFYSWMYVVSAAVLAGRFFFLRIRSAFLSSGNQVGSDTEYDFMRGVILFAFIIGVTAWILPGVVRVFVPDTVEQNRFTQRWETISKNFENVFYSLNQQANTVEQSIAENMALGTGQILGKEEVLLIQTDLVNSTGDPFYWRGKVYDVYLDGRWSMGSAYKQHFRASQKITDKLPSNGQMLLKARVTSKIPELTQVYITGETTLFSRAVDSAVAVQTVQNQEMLAFYMKPLIRKGDTYRFESIVSIPTAQQLRETSGQYPSWVLDRYLQLPGDVSQRVLGLAKEITRGQETVFDKVTAVTLYLRENIQYQSTIQAPPRNQDPIDWFLFDYKKGFCNYYASAEVLLLRAAGIPARLAVGYAQGTPGESGTSFVVKRDDSHAWPEVYFQGYGWIPFEPTGSQPYSDRSSSHATISQNNSIQNPSDLDGNLARGLLNGEERANRYLDELGDTEPSSAVVKAKLSVLGWILVGCVSLGVLIFVLMLLIRIRRDKKGFIDDLRSIRERAKNLVYKIPIIGYWLRSLNLHSSERNFLAIEISLAILGQKIQPSDTALELAAQLSVILPDAQPNIESLLQDFHRSAYGIQSVDQRNGTKESRRIVFSALKKKLQQTQDKFERINQRFTRK